MGENLRLDDLKKSGLGYRHPIGARGNNAAIGSSPVDATALLRNPRRLRKRVTMERQAKHSEEEQQPNNS